MRSMKSLCFQWAPVVIPRNAAGWGFFWCKFNQPCAPCFAPRKIWGRPVCRFFRRRSGCRDGFLAQCCNPFEMGCCFFAQFFFGTKVLLASIVWWPSFLHLFDICFPVVFWCPYLGSRPYVRSIDDWPLRLRSCVCFPGAGDELYWRFPVDALVVFFGSYKQGGPLPFVIEWLV